MIPVGKINELSTLTLPGIIRPQEVLLDASGTPVGYTMPAVPDAFALCQTFPRAFRDRHHLSPDNILMLVKKLQAGVSHIHSHGILIVDLNEMNFLVAPDFGNVYFIDVDSYQTAHYPATALMDSIRDRHSSGFTPLTDWFSFGIISFQMLVGIHPYKGKHPDLGTLDERMHANVSVLNAAVTIPAVCQPFSVIPTAYREWYMALFERGERVPPPEATGTIIVPVSATKHILTGNNVVVAEVGRYDGNIVAITGSMVLTTQSVWSGTQRIGTAPTGAVLGVTARQQHPVTAWIAQNVLHLCDVLRRQSLDLSVNADEIMATGGRIYLRQNDLLLEVFFTELPTRLIASVGVVGTVLAQATHLFDNVVLQNLLGATYLGLLPSSGSFHEVRVPELDGYRIADAMFEGGVFVAIAANHAGRYDRFVLRFDDAFSVYDLRRTEDIGMTSVNFTVLDTGVVALLNERDELELFARARGSAAIKIISDPGINGSCHLFHRNTQALFARDDCLYQMTMKKPS